MSQQELLTKVVRILDECGIEYMITGSLASSLQGEPRATHDIDVVVAIDSSDVDVLANAFPHPDYYFDKEQSREAVSRPRRSGAPPREPRRAPLQAGRLRSECEAKHVNEKVADVSGGRAGPRVWVSLLLSGTLLWRVSRQAAS